MSASGEKSAKKRPEKTQAGIPGGANAQLPAPQVLPQPSAIIVADRNLVIKHWSDSAQTLFGWSKEEVCGCSAPEDVRCKLFDFMFHGDAFASLQASGAWSGTATLQRKGQTPLAAQVAATTIWNENGAFDGLVAVLNPAPIATETGPQATPALEQRKDVPGEGENLTEINNLLQKELQIQKQAALAARESEGRNRDLVDNIKLGIFRCTPGRQGKFLEVNKAMEEITGYSRLELLSIMASDLLPANAETGPFQNEINITNWKDRREFTLVRKDGRKVTAEITVVAIRYDSGVTRFFDDILEDVTEQKQTQLQVQDSLERLQKTIREIIEAMAYIGEVRDPYTAGHQRRVAQLSLEIARKMGLVDEKFEGLTMAAFVHDIGKIIVPADILSKPGKLTKPEFDMLKDHSRIGYEILKTIEFPWPIATIVLQHHERLDGSGYPSGLSGEQIVLEARILAVADVVEAMSSHRPYRPALGTDRALEEINLNRSKLYDPNVVDACATLFRENGFSLN